MNGLHYDGNEYFSMIPAKQRHEVLSWLSKHGGPPLVSKPLFVYYNHRWYIEQYADHVRVKFSDQTLKFLFGVVWGLEEVICLDSVKS